MRCSITPPSDPVLLEDAAVLALGAPAALSKLLLGGCDAGHCQIRANAVPISLDYGGLDMTTVDFVQRFARTTQTFERRTETSDGLVAVALWSVGGLALTLLVIWLGSGAEFLILN